MAAQLAARPARGQMTFGLKRAEILSGQVNGATLLVLGLLIVYEGIRRLIRPPDVAGEAVLAVALVGIVVNLAASWTLGRANRRSMNVEGAFQHILTDLARSSPPPWRAASCWPPASTVRTGIASLVVAAIMLKAAYGLLKSSRRVFLEAAPEDVDVEAIGRAMAARLRVIERLLRERFDIEHTTLQVEHEGGELLVIEQPEQRERTVRGDAARSRQWTNRSTSGRGAVG